MDIQQLHATAEADLPRVLGGILQPEKKQHNLYIPEALWGGNGYQNYECQRCDLKKGLSLEEKERWLNDNPCPIPDPIDIKDANLANEFKDRYVAEFGEAAYFGAISDVLEADKGFINEGSDVMWMTWWMIGYGRPVHILLACASLELERGSDG